MEWQITVRDRAVPEVAYIQPDARKLQCSVGLTGGDGTLADPYRMRLQIINVSGQDWEGVIHLELCFGRGGNPRFFLPGFMYGTNRGEAPLRVENEFPRLRRGEKNRPASPWWMVRSDRLSHPAAFVYLGNEESQQGGRMYGLCASPYFILENGRKEPWKPGREGEFFQYTGFSCSIEEGRIGYTLGYENAPWLYVQSHTVRERAPLGDNCFALSAGETVDLEVLAYEYEAEDARTVYSAVASVYEWYHEAPRIIGSVREAVSDLAHAVSEDAWIEEDKSYTGFVFLEPDGSFRYNKIYSLSWTNGLASAVPVLMAALRLDDEAMRQQALACIDMIVENSMNPGSGLPYSAYEDGVWSNHGWWFDGMHTPGHSSYLIGQAVYYVLKSYEYEKTLRGILHSEWLAYSEEILERLEQTRNTEEEYPYILSEKTGAGLEYDSFGSCWCLTAAAYYCLLTGDNRYLEGLKRSETHYYKAYVAQAECYGGPADTDKAMDSEGILAYMRAAACLHKITGEEQYLDHLRDAISYEATFKFCYNSPVKVPPLSRLGWSSCGGSITSVANPHIHPMSASVIDEMTYYLTCRQDAYIASRRRDTILWCCQTYNRYDGEYDYGKKGWMSERFCHCQGLLTETYSDESPASTWFALMPWAVGSILEGFCGTLYSCLTH